VSALPSDDLPTLPQPAVMETEPKIIRTNETEQGLPRKLADTDGDEMLQKAIDDKIELQDEISSLTIGTITIVYAHSYTCTLILQCQYCFASNITYTYTISIVLTIATYV